MYYFYMIMIIKLWQLEMVENFFIMILTNKNLLINIKLILNQDLLIFILKLNSLILTHSILLKPSVKMPFTKLIQEFKKEHNSLKNIQLAHSSTLWLLIRKEDMLLDHKLDKLGFTIKLEVTPTASIHLSEIKYFTYKVQEMEDGY